MNPYEKDTNIDLIKIKKYILALNIFNLLDILSTYIGIFYLAIEEINPIFKTVVENKNTFLPFAFNKIVVICLISLVFFYRYSLYNYKIDRRGILILLSIYIIIVINNIFQIIIKI